MFLQFVSLYTATSGIFAYHIKKVHVYNKKSLSQVEWYKTRYQNDKNTF